ncbi:unnamed protein product [Larinioides sclopetarius]|uniref:Uncharacterized protein n=1 Tax=Larinioides sclopetarius TaxID=280406 RepID=A0AAV2ADC2_9ARAC
MSRVPQTIHKGPSSEDAHASPYRREALPVLTL